MGSVKAVATVIALLTACLMLTNTSAGLFQALQIRFFICVWELERCSFFSFFNVNCFLPDVLILYLFLRSLFMLPELHEEQDTI